MFRMSRSGIRRSLDPNFRDYSYFEEKGWFESEYYYPVALGPARKLMGRVFDRMQLPG
jgi:hypothetical protein